MTKIVLSVSRDIPLNKLVLSQANVRRIKAGVSVEELAEDIARRGLLQSLSVRPVRDGQGQETGAYEVPAGGRRFQALQLLVKQKRLAKTAPVPCLVKTDGVAEEDSLAENTMREALHPLDQFRAFQALRDEHGLGDEEIAARFFVTPAVVRQRLKLVAVSPKLLDLYAENAMSLEQLMCFTVTNDHARQEQVWEGLARGYNKEPYTIRRLLTEGAAKASDKRAVFVGAEAYEAAGGVIARDLFQHDGGGWFENVALLDRLAREKLEAVAAEVCAEGWKWLEVALDFPYGHTTGLRRVAPTAEALSAADQAAYDALRRAYDEIEAEYEGAEELPDDVDARLGEIEQAVARFEDRAVRFDPAVIARGGAFVSLGASGTPKIERGFVRPEDLAPAPAPEPSRAAEAPAPDGTVQRAAFTMGAAAGALSEPDAPPEAEEDGCGRLSDRLMTELSAHRTLALREALANDPDAAFLAVLHALALRTFYGSYTVDTCLEIEAKSVSLKTAAGPGLNDTALAQSSQQRHGTWSLRLPRQPEGLWDDLLDLDGDSRAALFAHCVAGTVNALSQSYDRRPRALAHADAARHAHGPRYGGALDANGRHLSRSGHEGADPGRGAGGQGRDLGAADRASQEERHGARSRAAARGHGLAAAGAAHPGSHGPGAAPGRPPRRDWRGRIGGGRCGAPGLSGRGGRRRGRSSRALPRGGRVARRADCRTARPHPADESWPAFWGGPFLMGRPGAPRPARASAPAQSRLRRVWGAERAGDERERRPGSRRGRAGGEKAPARPARNPGDPPS